MKCPKCGEKMQDGYLQAGNMIAFNKTRHKISLNSKDAEDVMIYKKAITTADFSGYICKNCGLIIFDYKNPI